MDSPQLRIMQELRNDDGKKFALIINDMPVIIDGRQVYVKSQQSTLVTVIYKKVPNKVSVTEIPVDLEKYWKFLTIYRKFYGLDFSEYMESSVAKFKVSKNQSFEMLFIESPAVTLIKDCIRASAGKAFGSLQVQGLSSEFWAEIQEKWFSIRSEFQVTSAIRYNVLINKVMKRRIDNKMFLDKNRLFKQSLDGEQINFIYLFLRTTGLYNPFLEDEHLIMRAKDSWFFDQNNNNRLFIRNGRDYMLHCMTVRDFCLSIGLPIKLGFTSETALLFLFSLLYNGNYNSIEIPLESMKGFISVDRDFESNRVVQTQFHSEEPETFSDHYDRIVMPATGLEAFAVRYATKLGNSTLKPEGLRSILADARIERR